jgi:ABC-type lipoprotein release transport system permease subunit
VRNVGLVDRQPLLLALVIGVLAGAALLHALVTSVRASRGQIGVLRALGFTPGQVGGSVAWHATAIAGAGLLVGVPLGIVTGRLLWRMIADDLGLESPTALPVLAVIAVVVLVLVVANLASYVPGRLAATTRPAEALRVE